MKKNNISWRVWILTIVIISFIGGFGRVVGEMLTNNIQGSETKIKSFPSNYKDGFISTCKETFTEQECSCVMDYYENKYTYSEYLKVARDTSVIKEAKEYCIK